MKILVTGVNGQLGYDIVRRGIVEGLEVVGIGKSELDITIKEDVNRVINDISPDVIIHCAAYTAVDRAEDDRKTCWEVNVEGTKHLAEASRLIGAKFLYISTDYVFDGEGTIPFTESDIPNPSSVYGVTKYEGEKIVRDVLSKYFIVRISWVFGINGNNFVKTMLKLSKDRNEINVVDDQYGSPTYTYDIAEILLKMVFSEEYGIYNASNEGYCSWAEFAEEIYKQAKIEMKVNRIDSKAYSTKATRPLNSKMSKQKLNDAFGSLPTWENALKRYIDEIKSEVKL